MLELRLHDDYSRSEVHDIFAPGTAFTPQTGNWGLHGIVAIPSRPGDYVFFVTFGQQQGDHVFDEGVTEDGVLTWQSQPRQSLNDNQIQQLIRHDELKNSIYLFLRTRARIKYTYLGMLKYLSHDNERENPVYFQWQILDWDIPKDVIQRKGLVLQPSSAIVTQPLPAAMGVLEQTPFPDAVAKKGTATATFNARKVADYSGRDAKNRKLGRKGELLVLEHEKRALANSGRHELSEKVLDVAGTEGDGAGYDVLSFTVEGKPKYIEVKTTRGPESTAFYMSSNEVAFAALHADYYYLYRVYEYDDATNSGKFFVNQGHPERSLKLTPAQYRVNVV